MHPPHCHILAALFCLSTHVIGILHHWSPRTENQRDAAICPSGWNSLQRMEAGDLRMPHRLKEFGAGRVTATLTLMLFVSKTQRSRLNLNHIPLSTGSNQLRNRPSRHREIQISVYLLVTPDYQTLDLWSKPGSCGQNQLSSPLAPRTLMREVGPESSPHPAGLLKEPRLPEGPRDRKPSRPSRGAQGHQGTEVRVHVGGEKIWKRLSHACLLPFSQSRQSNTWLYCHHPMEKSLPNTFKSSTEAHSMLIHSIKLERGENYLQQWISQSFCLQRAHNFIVFSYEKDFFVTFGTKCWKEK